MSPSRAPRSSIRRSAAPRTARAAFSTRFVTMRSTNNASPRTRPASSAMSTSMSTPGPPFPDTVDGGPDQIVEVHRLAPGDQRARFDPRHVQQVRDQLLEPARGCSDILQHLAHDVGVQTIATEHVRDRRRDGRHRALQLVGRCGQQGAAHVFRRAIQLRLSELCRQALARHHEGYLVGEGTHDPHLGRRQRGPRSHEDQRSERGLAHAQRDVEAPHLDVVRSPARRP